MRFKQFTAKPSGSTVRYQCTAKGMVNFFCTDFTFLMLISITGEPKPTVKWSKDNQKNTIERHLGSVKQNKFYLILEDVTPYDSGLYTCNVSNSLGWIGFTFELLVQGEQMLL